MEPAFSIIIPVYNSLNTLIALLDSIFKQADNHDFEVIVVDDCSTDDLSSLLKRYAVNLIRNETNIGSAASRNKGARISRAGTLIFFDSDVILEKDTLSKLVSRYREIPAGCALIGIYGKEPAEAGFIPEFKALLDYSHWQGFGFSEVTSFEPRCAIIDKVLFERIGFFDENIKGADVEDYEFGYRLLQNGGKIYIDESIQVRHHFPVTLSKLANNFFFRTSSWVGLFMKRHKFDNVATTKGLGVSCLLAFFSVISLFASFFLGNAVYSAAFSFIFFVILTWKFFGLVFKEKGVYFLLRAVFTQFLLCNVIVAGAMRGFINSFIRRKK
ncbi:MAG: glycosyltransferase [Candidatus Omnitrophota bacterium]|jgi:GT2 family glycosyltransferase|nr:MAG: glycosyltransferase [Candidatus Omnitrophota bacterium]